MTDQSPTERTVPNDERKAQLFCPACRHTAPATGDWLREDHPDASSLRCPVCETLVVRQPATARLVPL